MTNVDLGPRCAVFSLLDCRDGVTHGTVRHSSATEPPALDAKIGIR